MKTIKFRCSKLVRDNIPEILAGKNIKIEQKILEDNEEYLEALKAKLIEESKELSQAKTQEEVVEELADILEVYSNILKAYNLSHPEVEQIALKKNQEKGGFSKKIFVSGFELEESNPSIDHYRSQPDQYTEE